MTFSRISLIGVLTLSLAACNMGAAVNDGASSSSAAASQQAASSEETVRETHNVSYQGKVQKAGMSIYMQGTHRLELPDGRFVLLESDDLDLDIYVAKQVAVLGSARPTVEGDSTILRVEQITLLQQEESSASSEMSSEESSDASEDVSSAASSAQAVSSKTVSSKAAASSIAASSVASSVAATPAPAEGNEADVSARAAVMAKANMAESLWTQQYCSTHIGFCFPVHKNWWFKSFGTTTSYLWHVEISTEDITELGQGPLVVNLMSGSTGNADGEVKTQGDFVIGYKAFNETSHFEVSGPKSLEAAVRYIVNHIQAQ